MRLVRLRSIVTASACALAVLGFASRASAQIYHASLSGAQENPAAATSATGAAKIEINEANGTLTFTVVFNNLTSAQTLSHIHAPAAIGANVGVAINFGTVGGTSGTIAGQAAVTPTQIAQIRSGLGYVNVHSVNFPNGEIRGQIAIAREVDYDGDGRTDPSVLRFPNIAPPGVAQITYYNNNSTTGFQAYNFGDVNKDFPAPGDYDGDGKTDIAVYRDGASTPDGQSLFIIHYSSTGQDGVIKWGTTDDDPVAADYDGDGKTDVAIFRRGANLNDPTVFYIIESRNQNQRIVQWGLSGDDSGNAGDVPVVADYDRDGKADIAVLRTSNNIYFVLPSTGGFTATQWGLFNSDYTMTGDHDGDGKADYTAVRTGATATSPMTWWTLKSADNSVRAQTFGFSADSPLVGDYDGDGRADLAIYRNGATAGSQSFFWIFNSFTATARVLAWGVRGDFPVATYSAK